MFSLATRADLREKMDAPDCSEPALLRTVRQFASINRLVARYRAILRRWVIGDMQRDPARTYSLLDMGAGGCDIDAWLLAACRRQGLRLRVVACDSDPRIAAYARATRGNVEGLAIRCADVLAEPGGEDFDYVFANHLLHHFTDPQIVVLLRVWAPRVRRALLFSDLHRAAPPYAGFALLSLFYPNSFARHDGLLSIRRGFIPAELAALAAAAGIGPQSAVHRLAPGRLLLRCGGREAQPSMIA